MPIYEYRCQDCALLFERRQRVDDQPMERCPECGGKVRKVIQLVGIIFKGRGFYSTDNRSAK